MTKLIVAHKGPKPTAQQIAIGDVEELRGIAHYEIVLLVLQRKV